ncbi:MAG: hypothetical protein ACE5KH_06275 [Candidatus Geothermarchaeales archaeon]
MDDTPYLRVVHNGFDKAFAYLDMKEVLLARGRPRNPRGKAGRTLRFLAKRLLSGV